MCMRKEDFMVRRPRFTESQIVGALKQVEEGHTVKDVCRAHGVSENTNYNRKAKYGGMTVSDLRRLKALEDENTRLKQIVADPTLDNRALKAVVAKNF